MPGIRLAKLSKTYTPPGSPPVRALDRVDLEIRPGEFVVVVGHNGSGKSTLLNVISGMLSFDAGALMLFQPAPDGNEHAISEPSAHIIAALHQNPSENVVVDLTVAENLALAQLRLRFPSLFRPAAGVGAGGPLDGLSLGEAKSQARVRDLSGGQRQLLALQLALERGPKILLLDEPTTSLDRANAQRVLEAVQRIWEQKGITVILVTHDLPMALSLGTRLIVMAEGRVVEDMTGAVRTGLSLEHLFKLCGFGLGASSEPLNGAPQCTGTSKK